LPPLRFGGTAVGGPNAKPRNVRRNFMTDQIERLLKNYCNARKSWEAWCYLSNFNLDPPQFDTKRSVDKNELLSHLRYLALKDFHIEFYKMTKESKNNGDNIFDLLKTFAATSPEKQQEVTDRLSDLESERQTIDSICALRDKFYAHLDKKYESYIYKGATLTGILNSFIAIEKAIITLTSLATIQARLDEIPSRYDFRL
jgi:hypothetical protein